METHEKRLIRDNYRRLVENINPIQLIPYLPCVQKFHREEITNTQHAVSGSRLQAAIKMVDILQTRPLGFRQLVEALRNPEVDMGDIADRLDPPDESSVQQKIETSEMTQKENETQRLSRKPSKRPVTMETPLKHLPISVFNRLREMDAGQLKNADKLAEVIDLTFQEVENIKAHCSANDSLTIKYLRCWNEKEDITLQKIFDALDEVGRIDLIEELNSTLKVNYKPNLATENGDVEEHGVRSDFNVASSLASEIQHSNRPQNVQTCCPGYPDVTQHTPNGITAAGETTRTDEMHNIQLPNITMHSRTDRHFDMEEPNACASSNLPPPTSDWVTDTRPNQQKEDVHSYQSQHSRIGNVSALSAYTDNLKQVSVGSLESNDRINRKCEKQVKFTGYAIEELLSNSPSDIDRYAEKEKEDLKKNDAGKFVGYSGEDILGAACNGGLTADIPPQTIMDNLRDSSKPLEHRFIKDIISLESPNFETPDEKLMSPRSELNFDSHSGPVFEQNNFDRSTSSRSSNTDNSAYASLSSNQDFDSSEEDKKEDNDQKVCELINCVEKLETWPNEMGNIAEISMVMPSNESQNGASANRRSDSVKGFEVPTSDVVRRFENELMNRPDDADWLMTDYVSSSSSKISSKENSSFYSYVSEREDIDRPKLSIDSELNSIQRKAKKCFPGIPNSAQQIYQSGKCHESHQCSLNMANDGNGGADYDNYDDDDDEHVSVDGESPSVNTILNHAGILGDNGINYQPGLPQKVQDRTIPSLNEPISIQQPPNVPNFGSHGPDILPYTNFDLPNANRLDNQEVLQLTDVNNQVGTEQYGPYSVHMPPKLVELNDVSHANYKTIDNNGNVNVNEKSVASTQEVEVVQQSEDLDRASVTRGRTILNSSLKVAFDVFKTTYDSLL